MDNGGLIAAAQAVAYELLLFAGVGFAVFGIDDVVADCLWIVRSLWRRLTIYRHHPRATAATLLGRSQAGRIAILVPAWDEAAVIGAMLRHTLAAIDDADYRIYVGVYPNDAATRAAVQGVRDPRLSTVIVPHDGPTTKADCLNALWNAVAADDRVQGRESLAIVLHDAEDVVHHHELTVFRALIGRFDFVQLPVAPLINPRSPWIEGHYADEFAESHHKSMVVREAIGAGIPAAGVGCAFRVATLARLSSDRDTGPFDQNSLTEDYELGLRLADLGMRGAFVRIPEAEGTGFVAVQSHFPDSFEAALRQKSRWIAGIALAGWDRLGWTGGFGERWMRWRDRRAIMNALLIGTAYAGIGIQAMIATLGWFMPVLIPHMTWEMQLILWLCFTLLVWRLAMRAFFTSRLYGWRQGLLSIPRAFVANAIAIVAALRALRVYRQARREGRVRWDKTAHRFPDIQTS